jgi:hypothetical protein
VLLLDTRTPTLPIAAWPHGCDSDTEPPPSYLSIAQLPSPPLVQGCAGSLSAAQFGV